MLLGGLIAFWKQMPWAAGITGDPWNEAQASVSSSSGGGCSGGSCGGSGGGGGGGEAQEINLEILIGLLRARQTEQDIREQTRLLENSREHNRLYRRDSRKLSIKQYESAAEIAKLEAKAAARVEKRNAAKGKAPAPKAPKGDANKVVIDALVAEGKLLARGRLKHQYPHSWRSKKPVIFRNTPQWFISMDKDFDVPGAGTKGSLRDVALGAIGDTKFVPGAGQARLHAMIENRPDWVISRQRAWGVPITVFVHKETGELLRDPAVNARIVACLRTCGRSGNSEICMMITGPGRTHAIKFSAENPGRMKFVNTFHC